MRCMPYWNWQVIRRSIFRDGDCPKIRDLGKSSGKVLHDLSRARLVGSIRGAGGGHRFIGNPRRTTLYDVVSIFEDFGNDQGPLPEPEPILKLVRPWDWF